MRANSRVWLAAVVGGGAVLSAAGGAGGQDSKADRQRVQAALMAAEKAVDRRPIEKALREAFAVSGDFGLDCCKVLLGGAEPADRLLAAGVVAELAEAPALARLARLLDRKAAPDERRLLVRAIGERKTPSGRERAALVDDFLKDADLMIRAAAAQALADCGRAEVIGQIVGELRMAPRQVKGWETDEQGVLQMSYYGMVATLTGGRPEGAAWVREFLKAHRGEAARAEDRQRPWVAGEPAAVVIEGDELRTASFDIRIAVEAMPQPRAGREADFAMLTKTVEEAAERAREGAEKLFGRVHLPPILLVFADDKSIASQGGTSRGYFGTASGNKIVMRYTESAPVVASVLAHEYVHIIHSANYEDQPRWMAEGLAESLSKSQGESMLALAPIGQRGPILARAQAGLATRVTAWRTGGNSGEDPDLYSDAYALVDFLRFGPFSTPNARLHGLMGRLARGETADRAFQGAYGVTLKEIDRMLPAWLVEGK